MQPQRTQRTQRERREEDEGPLTLADELRRVLVLRAKHFSRMCGIMRHAMVLSPPEKAWLPAVKSALIELSGLS